MDENKNQARDFSKLVQQRVYGNTCPSGKQFDKSFSTVDRVAIKSRFDVKKQGVSERQKSFTDFALMNLGAQSMEFKTAFGKRSGKVMLRSAGSFTNIDVVDFDGEGLGDSLVYDNTLGICPELNLFVPAKISLQNMSEEFGEIKEVKAKNGKVLYHTISIGEYPKSRVNDELQMQLEQMFNGGDLCGGLKCTGRLFLTNGQDMIGKDFVSKQVPEFEFENAKYVRVVVRNYEDRVKFSDGSEVPKTGAVQWVKVELITFKIENFKDFEKGRTRELHLESEEMILSGLPFYPDETQKNSATWQSSLVRCFLNSAKSQELGGNSSVKCGFNWDFSESGFLQQALNLTRKPTKNYLVPKSENEICDDAFSGCVGLEKIVIPSSVGKIGDNAFFGCINTQLVFFSPNKNLTISENSLCGTDFAFVYIAKDNSWLVLSPYEDEKLKKNCYKLEIMPEDAEKFLDSNYRENFIQLNKWKESGVIKFIPPEFTIKLFPSSQMHKYFVNNNNQRWAKLVKALRFDMLNHEEKSNSLTDLMKIYYALGGFSQNQGESERAFDYTMKFVATTRKAKETPKMIADEIHERFSRLRINGAYNPTFASFFMKYYHQNPDFMNFKLRDKYGFLMPAQDYLCIAHNSFDLILQKYPNRTIYGNSERALLSPKFIAEHVAVVEYDDVKEGFEELAETIGRYGYKETQFQHMQKVFGAARKVKGVICAEKACGKNDITFRVLDKTDPFGFVLGDVTVCCQVNGGTAEKCVDDGYLNPHAGFLVFEENFVDHKGKFTGEKRVLAQAYVWYDPQTFTVCYDNIEVPKVVLEELRRGAKHGSKISSQALMETVIESANAIMLAMNKNGVRVERVTTGKGYNDLRFEIEKRFGAPEKHPIAAHRGYTGYTDARNAQYLISTRDEALSRGKTKVKALQVKPHKKIPLDNSCGMPENYLSEPRENDVGQAGLDEQFALE